MVDIDERSKRSIRACLRALVAFSQASRDEQSWNDARTALGTLGDTAGKLLSRQPREDAAFSSSLTAVYEAAEGMRKTPPPEKARENLDIVLGDVKYRVKRLFGIEVR